MVLIILLYMILASTFTLGKAVLSYTQPIFFIGVRMIAGGAILLAYLSLWHKKLLKFEREHTWLFVQVMFFHIYCAFVLEFLGLQDMSSAKACLLYSLSPFITALLSYWIFNERLSLKKIVGLCMGFVGFIPVLMATTPQEGVTFLRISMPEVLILMAVVSAAYGWLLVKKMMHKGYSPIMINGVGMLGGGSAALVTSLVVDYSPTQAFVTDLPAFLFYTAVLIVITNVIFYNLYGMLLEHYSATFISFVGFVCPLFAALYGRLFLCECVSRSFFISVGLMTFGLYLFYRQELQQRRSFLNNK